MTCNPVLMSERSESSISPRPIQLLDRVEGFPLPVLSPRSTRTSQVIVVQYVYAAARKSFQQFSQAAVANRLSNAPNQNIAQTQNLSLSAVAAL
jgi:hypothetical protein